MSTHKAQKSKAKSIGSAKPIVKGDVVLLSQKRIGVVRYIGEITEYIEKGIWYGIEIRMTAGTLGNSNGSIGNTTYFKCALNEGLFVKLHEIQRRIEPKELLEKVVKLTKMKNSMHQLLNQSHAEISKLKKKLNISTCSNTKNKKRSKKPNKKHPTFDDDNSGSMTYTDDHDRSISDIPRSSLEYSISNDYSVTFTQNTENSRYSKYSTYRKNANFDISDDDTLPSHDIVDISSNDINTTNTINTMNVNGTLSDPEIINMTKDESPSSSSTIKRNKMNRSQSANNDKNIKQRNSIKNNKKNKMNGNPFSNYNIKTRISTSTSASTPIQMAVPIQVATPLKAKNNGFKVRTQSQPQLMVAMHNELTPTAFAAKNDEIRSWDTFKVIEWIKSFAEINNNEWKKLLNKIESIKMNGDDLLSMDETNLLSDRLGIESPQIRYKIMSELAKQYQITQINQRYKPFPDPTIRNIKASSPRNNTPSPVPLLQNSHSSPANNDDAKVISTDNNNNNNNKPFVGYQRMSVSSSPQQNKKVTFGHNYDNSVSVSNKYNDNNFNSNDDMKQNEKSLILDRNRSFYELYTFFNKMDLNKNGKVDFNGFRFMLIEIDPDLEPYKLTNDVIQKCFNEFDLTKNGSITIEEFIVVMGKTYLRGLNKSTRAQLTSLDIKGYFIQLIKHFLKKVSKNINYNKNKHRGRNRSISRSRTRSGSKPPPPPRPRNRSTSRSRSGKPPPPIRRDISPSRSKEYKYNNNRHHHQNGHNHHNGHNQHNQHNQSSSHQ